MNAAIFFAPDAYILEGRQMMGRRAAGAAFLRAAVEGRGDEPVIGYTIGQRNVEQFEQAVRSIDPVARVGWVRVGDHARLSPIGALHRADPVIGPEARLRLRSGAATFSLTGITHTVSSAGTLDAIAAYLIEPVMPWDALICTSSVALDVARSTIAQAADFLAWRLGTPVAPALPQMPIIPLGVHASDWRFDEAARHAARSRLSIGSDEVAILFAGRLSYAAKAHPYQMFDALRAVAERSRQPIRLLLAGQFFNDNIEQDFLESQRLYAPNIRCQHIDGGKADLYAAAFSGADIFLSPADNIQETFGITPLEAMAAGLPVVVGDWNGYRDTVRDGVDGFRVPVWAPGPEAGENIAHAYEITGDYDAYSSRTSTTVSLDMASLVDRLAVLVENSDLRRQMGAAGRGRVLDEFDWSVVYRRYRDLWRDLGEIRRSEAQRPSIAKLVTDAPHAHPAHDDPYRRFSSYPSRQVTGDTLARAAPGASRAAFEALVARPIFSFWRLDPAMAERVIAAAQAGPLPIRIIAEQAGLNDGRAIEHIARLAKMNLLIFE